MNAATAPTAASSARSVATSTARSKSVAWIVTRAVVMLGSLLLENCARQGHRVADYAHVPRPGLRPGLLLYFAPSATRRPWRGALARIDQRGKTVPDQVGGAFCVVK